MKLMVKRAKNVFVFPFSFVSKTGQIPHCTHSDGSVYQPMPIPTNGNDGANDTYGDLPLKPIDTEYGFGQLEQ